MISGAVLSGIQAEMSASGTDIGELEVAPVENLLMEPADVAKAIPEVAESIQEEVKIQAEKL
jgi:hypothetical protein